MSDLMNELANAQQSNQVFNSADPETQKAIAMKQLLALGMSAEQAQQIIDQKFGTAQQAPAGNLVSMGMGQMPTPGPDVMQQVKDMMQSGDPVQMQKALELLKGQGAAPASQPSAKSLFDMK